MPYDIHRTTPDMIHVAAPPPAPCCCCGHITGATGIDIIFGHLVCRPCGDAMWDSVRMDALQRRGLAVEDMVARGKGGGG